MNNTQIRNPGADETAALKEIWAQVFGCEGLEPFFTCLYAPQRAIVAGGRGVPEAMGFMVPMGELVPSVAQDAAQRAALRVAPMKTAMLYAIATLPSCRGKGLGATVTNALIELAFAQGFDAAVLCPSDDGLFEFYKTKTPMRDYFYADETQISATSTAVDALAEGSETGVKEAKCAGNPAYACLPAQQDASELRQLTAAQYCALREKLLDARGIPYIRMSLPCLEYQQMLCCEGGRGGGLYQIGDACAAVEILRSGGVWARELIAPPGEDINSAKRAIIAAFPSRRYGFREPAAGNDGSAKRFAMLALRDAAAIKATAKLTQAWYGLAFE